MNNKAFLALAGVIVVVGLIIGLYSMTRMQLGIDRNISDANSYQNQNSDIPKPASQPTEERPIIITAPLKNTKISSPLFVTGRARGSWYFEASFPIKLLDGNSNIIAQTTANASGDWMTDQFVPFTAMLTFSTPSTSTGILRLIKDNPSGLPEKDDHEDIPIVF